MAFSFGAAAQPAAQGQTQTPSLFGQQQQQPAASTSTGFGFGQNNQQQAGASTGGSLFGQPNAATTTGGGLFGNTQATGSTSNLFGGQQQNQQAQPSTGLFGQPSTPAAGGGLFGSAQAGQAGQTNTGGGLFGQKPAAPSGGLFGSQQQQQPAQGGGLFGSTNQQAQQPQQGGLFGSTTQQPAGGGLFGSQPAPQQQQTSLFGGNNSTAGGGLFGAKPNPPAQGGLFGSAASAPSGGLFNSTAQPAGNSLFNSTAQPAGNSLFGSTAQPGGLLASTQQPLAMSTAQQEPDIETRIKTIQQAWDTQSPNCRFKYFFYNVVEPGTAQRYGRPAGATDDAKWARAVRDNPDPDNLVPCLATGWGDVQKRVQAQEQTASVHQQRVKELNQALDHLSRQTALSSSVRLQALQGHLTQITQRLLQLAAKSPSFAPAQSSAFRPEEGEMKHTLEVVKDTLDGRTRAPQSKGVGLSAPRPASKGRMLGQINELWGAIEEVRRHRQQNGTDNQQWASDQKFLTELAVVLEQQQQALSKLSTLANDAVFDADVIKAGLSAVERK